MLKYYFVTALPDEYQDDFKSAKDEWMKYAYLEFSETKDRPDSNILITWKDEGGAASHVGKLPSGRATEMDFGRSVPDIKRAFLHEFCHALGFQHEHQRPDRASSRIQFCNKPRNESWTKNRFHLVNPETLAAASLLSDKESIMMQVLLFL